MQKIDPVISWLIGVIFLLSGFLFAIQAPMAGLSLITAAGFLLPPVRRYVHSNTKIKLPTTIRVIAIFALLISSGHFMKKEFQELAVKQAQEKARTEAKLKQEIIDEFNSNSEHIITTAKIALSEKDYQSVISQTKKFLIVGNEEIKELNYQANKELIAIEKINRTESLLAVLKETPDQEYKKKLNLYQELSDLHPNDDLYKNKITYYSDKVEEEKKKQEAVENTKKSERLLAELKTIPEQEYQKIISLYTELSKLHPNNESYKEKATYYQNKLFERAKKQIADEKLEKQFSKWNGSHRNLEEIIKKSMNDPSSFEHVETKYWEQGDHIVVLTTFRGKNAFGGVVTNSIKAKVSLERKILEILER